jgi:outer membrane protein assembly factor BamE
MTSPAFLPTPSPSPWLPKKGLALGLLLSAALAGCASLGGGTLLYKPEVVQGNFISKEQVETIRPGQSRAQLRELLGTPLVTSLFHGDRWDYLFSLRRAGIPPENFKLTLFFQGELLERFEGDTMPSESEFVRRLDASRATSKAPTLQASDEALRKFAPPAATAKPAAQPSAAAAPSAPANYPPLEPR